MIPTRILYKYNANSFEHFLQNYYGRADSFTFIQFRVRDGQIDVPKTNFINQIKIYFLLKYRLHVGSACV